MIRALHFCYVELRCRRLNKFSDEQFIQPRICAEVSQILLIAEQNLKFCSRPQRKTLRNGGKDAFIPARVFN